VCSLELLILSAGQLPPNLIPRLAQARAFLASCAMGPREAIHQIRAALNAAQATNDLELVYSLLKEINDIAELAIVRNVQQRQLQLTGTVH
jgi:hypothetical protein